VSYLTSSRALDASAKARLPNPGPDLVRRVAATAFAVAKRARIHVPRAEPGARIGAARLRAQHV